MDVDHFPYNKKENGSRARDDEGSEEAKAEAAPQELNSYCLKEWDAKARRIGRHNTSSRRFSASNIANLREEITRSSFRSNFTISSTASSPGYCPAFPHDEIDPSTYSFTTALKALQARSGYVWECLSPDGFALNSKWSDAEKYICNPLSGEVPMECLSAKTLSGRSFRNLSTRVTMSAPLIYSNTHPRFPLQASHHHNNKPPSKPQEHIAPQVPIQEKKVLGSATGTRDVGIQSTPIDLGSSSPSPASTPSIGERMMKWRASAESGESPPSSNSKLKCEEELQSEPKEDRAVDEKRKEHEEGGRGEGGGVSSSSIRESGASGKEKGDDNRSTCRWRQIGCLSWMGRRRREKHKKPGKPGLFLAHISGC